MIQDSSQVCGIFQFHVISVPCRKIASFAEINGLLYQIVIRSHDDDGGHQEAGGHGGHGPRHAHRQTSITSQDGVQVRLHRCK